MMSHHRLSSFKFFKFIFCQLLSLEDHFSGNLLDVVAGEGTHRVEVVASLAFEALYQLADVGGVVVLGRHRRR